MAASDRYIGSFYTPVDGNGDVMPGAKLEFFVSGTNTHQDTYADADLSTPNANPVIADGSGTFPAIVLGPNPYKVRLSKADDTVVWTVDPVQAASAAIDAAQIALINAAVAAAQAAGKQASAAQGAAQAAQAAAEAAKDAAAASAASIDVSEINTRLNEAESDITTLDGEVSTLQAAFNGAKITYANAAAMNADLVPGDGTVATVLDTGTQYIKSGATGTGSWVPYPGDRYTQLENRVTNLDTPTRVFDLSDSNQAIVARTQARVDLEAGIAAHTSTTFSGTDMICERTAGALTSYNLFQGALLKQVNDFGNKTLTLTCTFNTAFNGIDNAPGLAVGFSPVTTGSVSSGHLLLGNAAYPAAGSSLFLVWRINGVVQIFDGVNGTTGGNQIQLVSGTGFNWKPGDTATMVVRFDEQATSAVVYFINNGILRGSLDITGLPASWYVGPFIRTLNGSVTNNTKLTVNVTQSDNRDSNLKTYYLDPSAPGGGDGSKSARFNSVFDCFLKTIQTGDRFRIVHAPGDYRTGTYEYSATDMQYLEFVGEAGGAVRIFGSTHVPSGDPDWVQPDAGTYPNVWARDFLYQGQPPITEDGAIIELDVPSVRNALEVLPWHHTRRLQIFNGYGTLDAALAACNSTPGSHLVSPDADLIYLHASDSGNPAAHNYEICNRRSCIAVRGSTTDVNPPFSCEVRIKNIECIFAYGTNIDLTRCFIDIEATKGTGAGSLNGLSPNDCTGQVRFSTFIGNCNDGINHSSLYGAGTPVPSPARLVLIGNTCSINGWSELYPFTDGRFYGDGVSNHTWADWLDIGGTYEMNGKCGVVPSMGNYVGIDIVCRNNMTANFQVGGNEANVTETMTLYRPLAEGGPTGFESIIGAGSTNSSATLTLFDPIARNHTRAGFSVLCTEPTGSSIINVYNGKVKANVVDKLISGTGVINVEPADDALT